MFCQNKILPEDLVGIFILLQLPASIRDPAPSKPKSMG